MQRGFDGKPAAHFRIVRPSFEKGFVFETIFERELDTLQQFTSSIYV